MLNTLLLPEVVFNDFNLIVLGQIQKNSDYAEYVLNYHVYSRMQKEKFENITVQFKSHT